MKKTKKLLNLIICYLGTEYLKHPPALVPGATKEQIEDYVVKEAKCILMRKITELQKKKKKPVTVWAKQHLHLCKDEKSKGTHLGEFIEATHATLIKDMAFTAQTKNGDLHIFAVPGPHNLLALEWCSLTVEDIGMEIPKEVRDRNDYLIKKQGRQSKW
jgi:hypothetical protein